MDKQSVQDGDNIVYKMSYWGNIIYSKRTLKGVIYIIVKGFQFNRRNFYNWINHRFGNNTTNKTPNRPLQNTFPNGYNKPQVRGYNGLYIAQNTKSGLYTIVDKKGNNFIKRIFQRNPMVWKKQFQYNCHWC